MKYNCTCIRANINIKQHKTFYEINSTLLLKTHFKPLSVCNNFCLHSNVDFGFEKYYRNRVFIMF